MKQKSLSRGESSFMTYRQLTMNKSSRQRLENVEKLGTIIKSMQKNKKEVEPQQILNSIKQKITNNYNNLYENYEMNKHEIIKNIQQTQNYQAIKTLNRQKLGNILKQKNCYDKLKNQIQFKQRKLEKILTIKNQLQCIPSSLIKLQQQHSSQIQVIKQFENELQKLNYQSAVLNDMKNQRFKGKLSVKQKHQSLLNECEQGKERNNKLIKNYYTKRMLLNKIYQKLQLQQDQEIPITLAEQLQKKLQQYKGKYTQLSILKHQTNLNKQQEQLEKQIFMQQQELRQKDKLAKQNQEKKEYEIIYNHFVLCKSEEEKIKKLCKVQSITEMANNSLECERQNLSQIRQNIQNQINALNQENERLHKQIEVLITITQKEHPKVETNLLELQKNLQQQQVELRKIKINFQRKQNLMNQWQASLNIITGGKYKRSNMVEPLKRIIKKYERYSERQNIQDLPTVCETKQLKKNSIRAQIHKKQRKLNIPSIDRVQTSMAQSQSIDI